MLVLRVVLGLAIAGQLALAGALYPGLPEEIPLHFDELGRPDRWGPSDAVEWFLIPALLALFGAALGYGIPPLAERLARNKSSLLNVPDRERFFALPEAARIRALRPVGIGVAVIGIELQVLMAFLMLGTVRVATADWDALPPIGIYGLVGLLLVTAIVLAVAGHRASKRAIREGG